MRTSEERIRELHRRMNEMEEAGKRRRYRVISAVAFALCFAVTVVMAWVIARLPVQAPQAEIGGAAASIFAEQSVLGYVVIALLAFCLGSLATIFCFRLKKHREKEADDDRTL